MREFIKVLVTDEQCIKLETPPNEKRQRYAVQLKKSAAQSNSLWVPLSVEEVWGYEGLDSVEILTGELEHKLCAIQRDCYESFVEHNKCEPTVCIMFMKGDVKFLVEGTKRVVRAEVGFAVFGDEVPEEFVPYVEVN